jgi:hypothetical protein
VDILSIPEGVGVDHKVMADLQAVDDFAASGGHGGDHEVELVQAALRRMCGTVTPWQWVIHGDSEEYRQALVRSAADRAQWKKARRIALCGRGDQFIRHSETGAVRVKARGCGSRLCPRCSRRTGRVHLRRVMAHLSSAGHGDMGHMVLTQTIFLNESLDGARSRFESAWKRFYPKLRRMGLRSALLSYHVKRGTRGGWHYHAHLLVEFIVPAGPEGRVGALTVAWNDSMKAEGATKEVFYRGVAAAGDALTGLADDQQLEFFRESASEVEKVLQYVVRDVLSGVEGVVNQCEGGKLVAELVEALDKAKAHRCLGAWRKRAAVEAEDRVESDAPTSAKEGVPPTGSGLGSGQWRTVGTVAAVFCWAKAGGREALEVLRAFSLSVLNRGRVSGRARKVLSTIAL